MLGIGAGWSDREHRTFGVPFPSTSTRLEMLDEYLQVVTLLLRSDEPVSFQGKHYTLDEAILLPRPSRPGGPPILVGGNGPKRTLPLAAKYADEWNAVFIGPERLRELQTRLDTLLDEVGRPRHAVARSAMVGTIFAHDESDLQARLSQQNMTVESAIEAGWVNGTSEMWIQQILALVAAGAERIMLQWLDQDNLADLEVIARDVLPHVFDPA